jgi:hypothetical protein
MVNSRIVPKKFMWDGGGTVEIKKGDIYKLDFPV